MSFLANSQRISSRVLCVRPISKPGLEIDLQKKGGDEEDHTLSQNHVGSSATFRNLQEDHDIAWARSKDLSCPPS